MLAKGRWDLTRRLKGYNQKSIKQMAIKQDPCVHTIYLFWGSAMQFLLQTL